MPDTIEDRAVVIVMKRRKPTETVEQFRFGRDVPILHELRAELARWAETITPGIPEGPTRLRPRGRHLGAADRGRRRRRRPLAAACAHGVQGDVWCGWRRRRRPAPTMLLADIKEVFDERMHGTTFLASNVLCDELRKIDDARGRRWN